MWNFRAQAVTCCRATTSVSKCGTCTWRQSPSRRIPCTSTCDQNSALSTRTTASLTSLSVAGATTIRQCWRDRTTTFSACLTAPQNGTWLWRRRGRSHDPKPLSKPRRFAREASEKRMKSAWTVSISIRRSFTQPGTRWRISSPSLQPTTCSYSKTNSEVILRQENIKDWRESTSQPSSPSYRDYILKNWSRGNFGSEQKQTSGLQTKSWTLFLSHSISRKIVSNLPSGTFDCYNPIDIDWVKAIEIVQYSRRNEFNVWPNRS